MPRSSSVILSTKSNDLPMSVHFQTYQFGFGFTRATASIFTEGSQSFQQLLFLNITPFFIKKMWIFRSPHGFADIDMQIMCQQLQREEENLCAQRGLVQGQDTQTFSIFFNEILLEKLIKLKNQVTLISIFIFCFNLSNC
jgi:hypothetical protein